jgi:hypothetical protein
MRLRSTVLTAVAAVGLASVPASAALMTFPISANGAEEVNGAGVPNQGDPDGSATGFITLNNGTGSGTTGSATVNLTLANLDLTNLTGHHIHVGAAGTVGPFNPGGLDLGDPDTIRVGNVLSGTITGLPAANITNIFTNPPGFYYNLHNGAFPAGAVRDQLPEPGCLGIVGLGAVGLLARRRSRGA